MKDDLRTPHPFEVMAKALFSLTSSGLTFPEFQERLIEDRRRRRRARIEREIKADLDYGRK